MEEKQALLHKENSQKNCPHPYNEDEGSSSDGSWWEESHSSCSSCCESRSESSFEWEAEIDENGQLFYIESDNLQTEGIFPETVVESNEKPENVKGGQLVSWMRRRDSRKHKPRITERSPPIDIGEKNYKEVIMKIDTIGQGATLCEKLLGLSLRCSEEKQTIVTEVLSNSPAQNCNIAAGDVVHTINTYQATPQSVENILSSLNFPCDVVLKVIKADENEGKKTKFQTAFVKNLINRNKNLDGALLSSPVGVVLVDMESQNLNKDDVIYSYPEKCVLSSCRGAFVTLFHLIAEVTPMDECQSSSVLIKKQLTHILYKSEQNFLLLMAIPQSRCTLKEASYILDDFIRCLVFNHQTLKRCFETTLKSDLDHFFSLFFFRLINGEEAVTSQFEGILPYVPLVVLPKEAQIQIDDALNELEANDIEHDEGNNISNQRLFNVIGSCFFHKGYLLASHLPKEDLLDVYAFYRQHSLSQLFRNEPVKYLVIWREVYPYSVNRGLVLKKSSGYPIPTGRWFLLIIGLGFDSIAVILEAGGCCAKIEGNPGPVITYVEEAEDTLRHMQKLGISSLASQWIENNSRFKTITPEDVFARKTNRKKENLLGFVKSFDGAAKSTVTGLSASPSSSKSSDITPTKRTRGQQETSEDSVSQTASNVSEVSDENAPILGRRGERSRAIAERGSDSESSDSDWDSSRDSNMRESTCSSGVENFYLGDVGEVIPAKLTTGPDYLLFHYIHLDGSEGVLINPPLNAKRATPKMKEILENFRRSAQIIHSVLENSIKFKKNGQEGSAFINKSLVAVKEHGVLFECSTGDSDSSKKPVTFTYWIVGRLFFTPQPREVYVCYYEDAPQNLVEIAFRLGLSAAG